LIRAIEHKGPLQDSGKPHSAGERIKKQFQPAIRKEASRKSPKQSRREKNNTKAIGRKLAVPAKAQRYTESRRKKKRFHNELSS
jgi:hypothetical protein